MAAFTVPDGFRIAELDAFLGELIGGQGMDRAVAHTGGDGLALRKFARACGFPSRSSMRDARAALAGLGEPEALATAKAARPAVSPPPPTAATRSAATALTVVPEPDAPGPEEEDQDPVPHASLLKECVLDLARVARESGSKHLAAAADRLVKTHDDLVAGLRSRIADQAKEQRIAELQAELARLRGKPTSSSTLPTVGTLSPGQLVRRWAAEEGIDCPRAGRIPARVQEAYDAAHESTNA